MGLFEASSGTPQLPLEAPSSNSYRPKSQKYKALPPRWKVPPGHCRLSPVRLSGHDLECHGGTFQRVGRGLYFLRLGL